MQTPDSSDPVPGAEGPGPDADPSLVLQEVINELVRDHGQDRDTGQHASALRAALRERGLPEMPDPWVRAVAEGAARGDAYVVDPRTEREADIPDPETMAPNRGIG